MAKRRDWEKARKKELLFKWLNRQPRPELDNKPSQSIKRANISNAGLPAETAIVYSDSTPTYEEGFKRIPCDICGDIRAGSIDWKNHKRLVHGASASTPVRTNAQIQSMQALQSRPRKPQCPICRSASFDLDQHHVEVHQKFMCPVCSDERAGTLDLVLHIRGLHIIENENR